MPGEAESGATPDPVTDCASVSGGGTFDDRCDRGTPTGRDGAPRAYTSPRIQCTGVGEVSGVRAGVEWGVAPAAESHCPKGAPALTGRRRPSSPADESVLKVGEWHDTPTRPRRAAHVAEYPVDHDALLYDGRLQTVYQLNATAYYVWRHCDGRAIGEIARSLVGAFPVDPATAIQHVREVIELLSIGALLTEDASNAQCV